VKWAEKRSLLRISCTREISEFVGLAANAAKILQIILPVAAKCSV
jgi:hypothetical protein